MIATLQCTVIDCPDPTALGTFYQGVLGWALDTADPSWVTLTSPHGARIAFQEVPFHRPPRWPDPEHPQQFHLDFDVPTRADVERAHEEVVALGAVFLHDSGGERSGFRVFADPAGHPFCLCYGQAPGPAVTG
ncbi:VOC family protein [Actinacidiphila glaucinigra]|uniref:Glyoxalase/Bleomycin resistance protein/Dioxygenase superfamily protein n=1 Tax=Actinacidiphila glaucinigra TaxID=235986 RepID=A0A238ZWW1_9ACTN|nr:VOC family protein [Actinacidiphila glaucinigra]SNR87133.1 Glyoxalase/Bleomycin resistance protein/Dioxygenase superfamily protein [Actinacidiphila glaucinigra]